MNATQRKASLAAAIVNLRALRDALDGVEEKCGECERPHAVDHVEWSARKYLSNVIDRFEKDLAHDAPYLEPVPALRRAVPQ